MANIYLTNIHTRKLIAENVILHNLYISKYVQLKKNVFQEKNIRSGKKKIESMIQKTLQ